MTMMNKPVGIIGTGSFLPDNVVTNFDLEKMVDTNDQWIRERTGIEERRIAPEGMKFHAVVVWRWQQKKHFKWLSSM